MPALFHHGPHQISTQEVPYVLKSKRCSLAKLSSCASNNRLGFTIIGTPLLVALERRLSSTSTAIHHNLESLRALPLMPTIAMGTAESSIRQLLRKMQGELNSLRNFASSPHLFLGARERAREWVRSFEAEILELMEGFEMVKRHRGEARWVVELFAWFDRDGEGRGGVHRERAVGWEEWASVVEEVFSDVVQERGGGNNDECDEEVVEGITEDGVETLRVLAEAYTAWFLGCQFLPALYVKS